jgi:hypothetical protein
MYTTLRGIHTSLLRITGLMATTHSVQVDLPADLYKQIREAAARDNQTVETMLVESLALLFGAPPSGWKELAASLETLPDEELWALVYRRLAWPGGARLRELTAYGKQAPLTATEQAELEALIEEADRYMLLRSRAALLLKERGYDVEGRLQLGARLGNPRGVAPVGLAARDERTSA